MANFPDPIRVELLGDMWQTLLPVSALVLSLLSIALTVAFRFGDRVKVRLEAGWPTLVLGKPHDEDAVAFVFSAVPVPLTVTNRSRSIGTTVHRVELQLRFPPRKRLHRRWPRRIVSIGQVFRSVHHRLEPGDSFAVPAEIDHLREQLRSMLGPQVGSAPSAASVRIVVHHGHGNKASKWVSAGQVAPEYLGDGWKSIMVEHRTP